ncbi:hypothetical protein SEA_SKOG_74 [Gordonia phage Skog]|uniref:Uncharacterized protein n=1 Tax=Gordonia phage Skog TaxID=2704033 RepID=A0A6G6XJM4_9CAUD|nr:hypothetical protein KHQ85_gp074 [Gordonia phage Skog]QIG58226.1 hypothetical protein SEA_SKOG_74 [Gordonia phage Skog]
MTIDKTWGSARVKLYDHLWGLVYDSDQDFNAEGLGKPDAIERGVRSCLRDHTDNGRLYATVDVPHVGMIWSGIVEETPGGLQWLRGIEFIRAVLRPPNPYLRGDHQ